MPQARTSEVLLPLTQLPRPVEQDEAAFSNALLTYQGPRQKRARLAFSMPEAVPSPQKTRNLSPGLKGKEDDQVPTGYKVTSVLSKMADRCVLLARRKQQRVALKILQKHGLTPKRSISSEAELMQQLKHPGIVKLLQFMEDEERVCLVMEYVPGGDMLQNIMRHGRFLEPPAARLLRQLSDAMSYMHSRNIVHRDLKPENILLTTSDREKAEAKISDFGISRLTMSSQDCHTCLGSRDYRAPEVVRLGMRRRREDDRGYGKPADMWSLGVVLYVMLSGERPYDTQSKVDLEIIRGLWSFGEVWASISQEAKDVVTLLMQQEPKKRLTAAQVLQQCWLKA